MQVVWDDSITRLFVLPTGNRPLGLLFRANKGQVDLEGAIGELSTPAHRRATHCSRCHQTQLRACVMLF
jgi:hypothetical protein